MFNNIQRVRDLQQVVQDPTESEYVQALTTVVATLEHRQLSEVAGLHERLGINGVTVQKDAEERQGQLLDLVDALASGEFEAWWFEEVIADHIENHEDARPYAGLSDDEWAEQQASWAEMYRDRGGESFAERSDEDLARMHVERKFSVSFEEFEREVVGYEKKTALQTVLAGNFEAVERGIRTASQAIESDRVVVLPEDIEDLTAEEIAEELAGEFEGGEGDGE